MPTVASKTGVLMVIPKGRSAAERRLGAIAALHSPQARVVSPQVVRDIILEVGYTYLVCGECKVAGRNYSDGVVPARWPCATARLLGEWPGEIPDLPDGSDG